MPSLRFRRSSPCPVCGGCDEEPRGRGERCYGFLSEDGIYAHCTREDHAGGLRQNPQSQTYAHRLVGDCRCGTRHDPSFGDSHQRSTSGNGHRQIVATYDYTDEEGTLICAPRSMVME